MCVRKLPVAALPLMTQNTRAAGVRNPNGGFHKDFQLKNSLKFSVKNLLRSESVIRAALG
jgi:hypothetical protein